MPIDERGVPIRQAISTRNQRPLNSRFPPHTYSHPAQGGLAMARDVARDWMWSEACEMLARAERMHREMFRPGAPQARQPAWEPPVDILENDRQVLVLVALPGVAIEDAQVVIEEGELVIAGV